MNLHKYKTKNKIQNMLQAKMIVMRRSVLFILYINVIFVALDIKFNNVSYSDDFFVDETTCSNQ